MEVMIQTAVLVTVILAVRKMFGEKLHAYIRYGLWLLVVLRLLIPVNLIGSPISMLRIGNVLAEQSAKIFGVSGTTGSGLESDGFSVIQGGQPENGSGKILAEGKKAGVAEEDSAGLAGNYGGMLTTAAETEEAWERDEIAVSGSGRQWVQDLLYGENTENILRRAAGVFRILWAAGAILVGGFLLAAHIRFLRRLYRMRRPLGKAGNIRIYRVDKLESPCLAGVVHPAVYIGSNIKKKSNYFRYTVTHETVHYLHGDHIWAVIRAVLVTVYWFHPFVWIAAAASARDGEIACDYGTVQRLGEKERMTYGTMLLDLSRVSRGKRAYSYGTMLRLGESEMKERILRLAGGNDSRMSAGIGVVLLMLITAGCAFTGMTQKEGENGTVLSAGEDNLSQKDSESTADPDDFGENIDGDLTEDTGIFENKDADYSGNGINGAEFDPDDPVPEQQELSAVPAVLSEETTFGADGPWLDYAGRLGTDGETIVIFHDYFGLVVFDLMNGRVLQSLDLAPINCHMTQGDDACEIRVSGDGTIVWLHPQSRQYMFRYEVEENLLYQQPLVKSFEIDLETEDLFDRYTVTEDEYAGWHSNFLYEEYKDEKGLHTTYIYLYVPDKAEQKLGSLHCIWDDMEFLLCMDGKWPGTAGTENELPYRYDGAVWDNAILYDEPCAYERISDTFGSRVHPVSKDVIVHDGIDYAAAAGTDVTAAADGMVYKQGYSEEHGIYVVLLHENGDMTYYCNCREITVAEGEQVKRGDKIAAVGNTGRSTGAHLHFALSRNGEFVDPAENMKTD